MCSILLRVRVEQTLSYTRLISREGGMDVTPNGTFSNGFWASRQLTLMLENAAGVLRLYQVIRGFPGLMPVWRSCNLSGCFSQQAKGLAVQAGRR